MQATKPNNHMAVRRVFMRVLFSICLDPADIRLERREFIGAQSIPIAWHLDRLALQKMLCRGVVQEPRGNAIKNPLLQFLIVADQFEEIGAIPSGDIAFEGTGVGYPPLPGWTVTAEAAVIKGKVSTFNDLVGWQLAEPGDRLEKGNQILQFLIRYPPAIGWHMDQRFAVRLNLFISIIVPMRMPGLFSKPFW